MKTPHRVPFLLATLAILNAVGVAPSATVEVTTDPVGFVSISVPAQSDVVLAVPLYRAPVFRSGIQSINGSVITVSATPGWTSNQFVQNPGTQNDTFAVLIATGDPSTGKEGMIGKITANTDNTLTIELDPASFAGIKTEATNPGAADQIDIMPYWTPASLLGTTLPQGTQLMLFPTDQSGINIGSQTTIARGPSSWLNDVTNADHFALFFGQGFVLRNTAASAQVVSMVGSVPMAAHRYVMKKNSAAGTAQDIRIGYASPIPEFIGNLHLGFDPGDQLLVFDNTAAGQNKSSIKTLVYNGGAWYDGATDVSNSFQLNPGQGYIFRRASAAPGGPSGGASSNRTWVNMQSYIQ